MDVAATETLTEMHGGLVAVLVCVVFAQAFQASLPPVAVRVADAVTTVWSRAQVYNGVRLLHALFFVGKRSWQWWEFKEEVQVRATVHMSALWLRWSFECRPRILVAAA
jgi:hypothetical protein